MNILFHTYYKVAPKLGGTERTTTTVALGLRKVFGHRIFSSYLNDSKPSDEYTHFDGAYKLSGFSASDFTKILKDNHIDVVINEGDFGAVKAIAEAISRCGHECKSIFAHHFNPGFENDRLSPVSLSGVRSALFPIYKYRHRQQLRRRYHNACLLCDKVVLLSMLFKESFLEFARMGEDYDKIDAIPNALSFAPSFSMDEYNNKQKEVVIVSRLDDPQKKISRALTVWRVIEEDDRFDDWNLTIVGDGPDRQAYENYASQYLKRVTFTGLKEPQPYYRRASIFLMTSQYEGWGLTISEAQQFGCVPIAFDTYLSLREIITSGENGIIVPAAADDAYINNLKTLMTDPDLRRKLAANALASTARFAPTVIINRWQSLITNL